MAASGKTQQEIASAFGISQQAFSQRLKTGKFTQSELETIASVLDAEYIAVFKFKDGKEI